MILYKLAYLTQKLYQLAYILRPTRYFYPIILLTLKPACTFSTYPATHGPGEVLQKPYPIIYKCRKIMTTF